MGHIRWEVHDMSGGEDFVPILAAKGHRTMQNLDRNRVCGLVIRSVLSRQEGEQDEVCAVGTEDSLNGWSRARWVRLRGLIEQTQRCERGAVMGGGTKGGCIIDWKLSHATLA